MSDLSLQLQQAQAQLPVTSYSDEALFQRELETIFQSGPRYVGHQLAVPEEGDFFALPQESGGRVLVRSHEGVELLSNVCRHRQAVILKDKGSLKTQDSLSFAQVDLLSLGQTTWRPPLCARPLSKFKKLSLARMEWFVI